MTRDYKRDPHQCVGKVPFETHDLAVKVANRRRKTRDGFKRQRPYKCEVCFKWHIGTAR